MLERLARLGYASKALIYAIVGGLAIAAAANRGGRVTDTSGALRVISRQPFGQLLLVVLWRWPVRLRRVAVSGRRHAIPIGTARSSRRW